MGSADIQTKAHLSIRHGLILYFLGSSSLFVHVLYSQQSPFSAHSQPINCKFTHGTDKLGVLVSQPAVSLLGNREERAGGGSW